MIKPVAVIGGGLGGLAAACTLAGRGYPVLLFERSPTLGGRCGLLEQGGFRFDTVPAPFTFPRTLDRIFRECNRKLGDYLDLISVDPLCRCFFPDGRVFDLFRDVDATGEQLDRLFPRSAKGYRRLVGISKRMHRAADKLLYWRSVGGLRDILRPSNLADAWALKLRQTVTQLVRIAIGDSLLVKMLEFLICFPDSAPDRVPARLCGRLFMQMSEGVWHTRGGNGAISLALTKLAADVGVDVRCNDTINNIGVDQRGHAATVTTDSGEAIPVRAVISNIPPGGESLTFSVEEESYDTVTAFLGLDRAYGQLGHHNFILSDNARRSADSAFYICAPSRLDPSVAPANDDALSVVFHVPTMPIGAWPTLWPDYRSLMMHTLATTGRMTEIEQHIQHESAACGLARPQTRFQRANRSTDVPGLYYAGEFAHPGPGIPMEIMSGWIAADALDEDIFKGAAKPPRT